MVDNDDERNEERLVSETNADVDETPDAVTLDDNLGADGLDSEDALPDGLGEDIAPTTQLPSGAEIGSQVEETVRMPEVETIVDAGQNDDAPKSEIGAPPEAPQEASEQTGSSDSPGIPAANGGAKAFLASKAGRIVLGAVAAALVLIGLFATHVICFHDWSDPTCTVAATCKKCGRTQGDPLGHDWHEATCTEPKTCARCGEVEGKALGHDVKTWKTTKAATCTAEGEETGTCDRCKEVQKRSIAKIDHEFGEWKTTKAPSCTAEGESTRACKACGLEEKKPLDKVDHTPGDWEITKQAEPKAGGGSTDGERVKRCTVCGEVLEKESYKLSDEELRTAFIDSCESPSFEDVARYPDDWEGKRVRFTGEVIQVMQDGNAYTLRLNVTDTGYFWTDTIMVYYDAPSGAPRILEDDVMTFYGTMHGMYSYQSVMGATITVPLLQAMYIE